jgi:2-oxoglutarate ferredoxin oxidoreductase subunit beta
MSELLATLRGTSYIERVTVTSPAAVLKTKKAIARTFEHQLKGTGFSMVEILSPCPTNWKMSALDAFRWVDEVMVKEFPLGVVKETTC